MIEGAASGIARVLETIVKAPQGLFAREYGDGEEGMRREEAVRDPILECGLFKEILDGAMRTSTGVLVCVRRGLLIIDGIRYTT
jgi:hypothetical protein